MFEGGGWLAEIPNLPGCMSNGEEVVGNLEDAKKSWIETCLELGRPVPEPVTDEFSGQLRIRISKSLHRILAERDREEKVSLNILIISPSRQLDAGYSDGCILIFPYDRDSLKT